MKLNITSATSIKTVLCDSDRDGRVRAEWLDADGKLLATASYTLYGTFRGSMVNGGNHTVPKSIKRFLKGLK